MATHTSIMSPFTKRFSLLMFASYNYQLCLMHHMSHFFVTFRYSISIVAMMKQTIISIKQWLINMDKVCEKKNTLSFSFSFLISRIFPLLWLSHAKAIAKSTEKTISKNFVNKLVLFTGDYFFHDEIRNSIGI